MLTVLEIWGEHLLWICTIQMYADSHNASMCGAIESLFQVLQVFESWAHHLGPDDFDVFAKPYADKAIALIKAKHPDVPIIYFANGGSAYLERQKDMNADMICVDWKVCCKHSCTYMAYVLMHIYI